MSGTEYHPEYYPMAWELAILLLATIELVVAGTLIKRRWTSRNESVPIPVAVSLWIGMAVLYIALALTFYVNTYPDPRKLTVLMWCLIFWFVPIIYFTLTVTSSVAMRTIERIGPFSATIDDPSEFAAARKLAIKGDIDGAVARYRTYTDNQSGALFEASRLLKSEDRFAEAGALLEETAKLYYGRRKVWAEAMYQLAKLYEVSLSQPKKAMACYREIMGRASETRFGQLAGADLARIQVFDSDFLASLGDKGDASAQDPFYRQRELFEASETPPPAPKEEKKTKAPSPKPEEPPEDLPLPAQDPFYAARLKLLAEDAVAAAAMAKPGAEEAPAKPEKRPSRKKPATSTKPAPAKAAVKAKPAPKRRTLSVKKAAQKITAKKKSAARRKKPPTA